MVEKDYQIYTRMVEAVDRSYIWKMKKDNYIHKIRYGSKGYRKIPIICEWNKECTEKVWESRSVVCTLHRKERDRKQRADWRKNNVEKARKSSRNSWKRIGYKTRKEHFKNHPEVVKAKSLYMKDWYHKREGKCNNCGKQIYYESEFCQACSVKVKPRGFVLHRK